MRRIHALHPLACAAGLVLATGATAQSSVTLSGIADASLRQVSNEGQPSVRSMASGANSTSRFILRGQEDLGGGWSAGFHLEHGLLLDAGSANSSTQFWDRRSTVSLAQRQWGELRLGRDFIPSYVSWTRFDPFSYVGIGGSTNFVSAAPTGPIRSAFGTSLATTVRSNNAVQWLSPGGWSGFEAGVLVAPGEGNSQALGQHKVTGFRVGYVAGPWNLSAAQTRSENAVTAVGGAFKDTTAGASYNAGPVRVAAAWRRFEQGASRQELRLLSAWIPVGAHEFKASWLQSDMQGRVGSTVIDANDARQLALGYVYSFSRRTALYATAAHISNRGAANSVLPGGAAQPVAGRASRGTEVGLRHSF